jgi:hypothetical protein
LKNRPDATTSARAEAERSIKIVTAKLEAKKTKEKKCGLKSFSLNAYTCPILENLQRFSANESTKNIRFHSAMALRVRACGARAFQEIQTG